MIVLAFLQILLGAGLASFSWFLASEKAHTAAKRIFDGGYFVVDAPPPHATNESILLVFSLAVLVFGLVQWKAHIKAAPLQTMLGLVTTVIYALLWNRAHGRISLAVPGIYYLAYLSLALGVVVFIVGLVQLKQFDRESPAAP